MRAILFILALSLSAPALHAQIGFGGEIGVGVAGMRFAPSQSPIYYTSGSANPVMAAKLGGLIDAPLNKHFTFQSGVYINMKGAIRSFSYYLNDSFNESVHQALILYYATLPLMLTYKTGIPGKGRVVIGVGADIGYLLWGTNHLTDNYTFNGVAGSSSGTTPAKAGQTVNGFDIGLALALGYELPTGLFFRLSYTNGTQDIGTGTEISKNRSGCITAGRIIGKGRNINKEADDLIDHGK